MRSTFVRRLWRAALAVAMLCGMSSLTPVNKAAAFNICGTITIVYYSDATHTHRVGSCSIPCGSGKETCTGQMTSFSTQTSSCHAC